MDITKEEIRALFRALQGANYERKGHPDSMNGEYISCKHCNGWQDIEDYGPMKHELSCPTRKDKAIEEKFRKLASL